MSKLMKIVLPLLIIFVAVIVAKIMISNRAPAERQAPRVTAPVVQTMVVQAVDYQVQVSSRGVVQARTRGTLIAQVGGEVKQVHADFRDGGFFSAGQVLVQIDTRDYQSAVTIAEAELIKAQQTLAEEEARSMQAARDWERLGGEGSPSDLTLRKPQLQTAQANLAAAEARLAQARLNLSRTKITLPYDGRVLSQAVDIGQVVAPGSLLGEVYATDAVEVRLPMSNRQMGLLSIPEQYQDQQGEVAGPVVELSAQVGDERQVWEGRIVRSEGAIDSSSRQTYLVARVDEPYARQADGRPPLKVGQYVEASIAGKSLTGVFVIPQSALVGDDRAYVVSAGNTLDERKLTIRWRGNNEVVVVAGLVAGERVVTTVPAGAVQGMQVRLNAPAASERLAP